jgi:hypothetical protein
MDPLTRRTAPPDLATASIASQSASEEASGFSTSTCTPRCAAAIVGAACSGCGVQMHTTSTPDFAIISGTSVYPATPYCCANGCTLAGERPHTATNSDCGNDRSAAACKWPTLPQPTIAVLSLRMEISHQWTRMLARSRSSHAECVAETVRFSLL